MLSWYFEKRPVSPLPGAGGICVIVRLSDNYLHVSLKAVIENSETYSPPDTDEMEQLKVTVKELKKLREQLVKNGVQLPNYGEWKKFR